MLKIRLRRIGKKKQPSFKVIISEDSWDTAGKFLEDLGFYNPRTKEKRLNIERIKYWLEKGAQVSNTLHNLLVEEGILKEPKVKIVTKKKIERPLQKKGKLAPTGP